MPLPLPINALLHDYDRAALHAHQGAYYRPLVLDDLSGYPVSYRERFLASIECAYRRGAQWDEAPEDLSARLERATQAALATAGLSESEDVRLAVEAVSRAIREELEVVVAPSGDSQ